jgi:sugar phosphate isomerase/epimerase
MKSCVTVSLVEEVRGGPFVFWDDLRAACEQARQVGFDAIEIFPPAAAAIEPIVLRRLLDDNQLSLAAIGTGAGWVKHRLQFADPSPVKRQQAIDFVRGIVDVAAVFGAGTIIGSMQGRAGDGVSREAARDYLADALQTLGEHCTGCGTSLFYEPLNRYETNQANTVAEGLELLAALSCDSVGLLCDLYHMNIEESDSAAALRNAGAAVAHIHFVDSNRRPAGQGQIDYGPIMAALRAIGYSGYLSAEAFPWPDSLAAAQRTMDAFRYWTRRVPR